MSAQDSGFFRIQRRMIIFRPISQRHGFFSPLSTCRTSAPKLDFSRPRFLLLASPLFRYVSALPCPRCSLSPASDFLMHTIHWLAQYSSPTPPPICSWCTSIASPSSIPIYPPLSALRIPQQFQPSNSTKAEPLTPSAVLPSFTLSPSNRNLNALTLRFPRSA